VITLIVPFYRNVRMLERQIEEWKLYPNTFCFVVVDDGSPEPAKPVVEAHSNNGLRDRLSLYRIDVDIPWNRGGARNLGADAATTEWIVHMDIDHVLPWQCAQSLATFTPNPGHWYRFPRFRKGRADETRRKDAISPEQKFGAIHPHVDSYLCTRDLYWRVGGYDEDYSGCLGGGSPFLKQFEAAAPVSLLPPEIHLHVYTRDTVEDASDTSLSRDTSEYSRRRRAKELSGRTKARNPLRFEWHRAL
jgi:hypothetical protein